MKQLSLSGFRIVVANGNYYSSLDIYTNKQIFKEKYYLVVMNCWGNDSADYCLMCDHAAANETSLMMYLKPELVRMDNLSSDTTQWPLGLLGQDPRSHASKEFGSNIVEFELKKMSALIAAEVAKIRK